MNRDIRWIQRFSNYRMVLKQMEEAVDLMESRELTNLEKQGFIQSFEYTHELGWKTLKDFLESRGHIDIYGSRDASRKAFALGLVDNGEAWMQMIKSRNITSHTYDENTANEIVKIIKDSYFNLFKDLKDKLNQLEIIDGREE